MVRLPYFADPKNLEIEEDQPKPEPKIEEGPAGETSLELLQNVYRNRKQPLPIRVRCAVEALQHEYPRVSAVAVTNMTGQQSFAEALERAIERSGIKTLPAPKVIEAQPVEQVGAEEMKKPFAQYRRNFRRY